MINWSTHPGDVIVVISDLHSNKRAIKTVLDTIKNERYDKLVVLGDILTYGIDTFESMDMIQSVIDKEADLIMGNHDEIYLDMISGNYEMFNRLRPDLQESIEYNFNLLDVKQFANWPWKKNIVHNSLYFSHANPFGNVWDYIKDKGDFQIAAMKIKSLKHVAGIFGHTHRAKFFSAKNGFLDAINGLSNDTFIINPGSVGQPRSDIKDATILRLSLYNNILWTELKIIPYDVKSHIQGIQNSSLSTPTKTILCNFF